MEKRILYFDSLGQSMGAGAIQRYTIHVNALASVLIEHGIKVDQTAMKSFVDGTSQDVHNAIMATRAKQLEGMPDLVRNNALQSNQVDMYRLDHIFSGLKDEHSEFNRTLTLSYKPIIHPMNLIRLEGNEFSVDFEAVKSLHTTCEDAVNKTTVQLAEAAKTALNALKRELSKFGISRVIGENRILNTDPATGEFMIDHSVYRQIRR